MPDEDGRSGWCWRRPGRRGACGTFTQQLGLDTLQINYNGALIWDEQKQQAIFHRPMAGLLVREIIQQARDIYADLLCSCEVMDRWFTDRHDPLYTTETGRMFKPDVICSVDEFCNQPITKLMFLGHPELISALEPAVAGPFDDRVSIDPGRQRPDSDHGPAGEQSGGGAEGRGVLRHSDGRGDGDRRRAERRRQCCRPPGWRWRWTTPTSG